MEKKNSSEVEVVLQCPLGKKCEVVKGKKIVRCTSYTKLIGRDPQTGEPRDEWGCSIFQWQPVLQTEITMVLNSLVDAVTSLRDNVHTNNSKLDLALAIAHQQVPDVQVPIDITPKLRGGASDAD